MAEDKAETLILPLEMKSKLRNLSCMTAMTVVWYVMLCRQ